MVLKDKAFYDNSNGGITVSGGEPTMQKEFTLQLLQESKDLGLNTAIETCGHTTWPVLKSILEYTDFIFYDIKCLDPVKHQQATGKDNTLILENVKRIVKEKAILKKEKTLKIRMPLIPLFNDSIKNIQEVLCFINKELGLTASDFEVLRYNNLGETKYGQLDRKGPSMEPQSKKYIDSVNKTLLRSYN